MTAELIIAELWQDGDCITPDDPELSQDSCMSCPRVDNINGPCPCDNEEQTTMGTWDTGPFDNDSAADFAADIQACSGPDARHDLLLATMRAGTGYLSSVRLTNEYSWGYEVEHAIAAAAFVADEHTGVKQFTNCSYARGVDDDMELYPYVEFHPPTPELLDAARKLADTMLTRMKRDCIDEEWVVPVREVRTALNNKEQT